MGEQSLEIELRVARDARHVEQMRLMRGVELDDLVGRVGFDAVAGGQHQIARDRGAGAEGAMRADDHHGVARAALRAAHRR